jgi:hypothetical protein
MRIRAYGDATSLPYFLEIKEKRSGLIRKHRGIVTSPDWSELLENYRCPPAPDAKSESQNRRFTYLVQAYQAAPKVRTQYRRKAYVSQVNEYGRLTLDRELKCLPEERFCFASEGSNLNAYDVETLFDPGCSIILELKSYANRVPVWMRDLIRKFDLHRRSFSKYVTSMSALWENTGHDPVGRASTRHGA